MSAVDTAQELTTAGRYAEARDILVRHVECHPNDGAGHALLGRVLLRLNDAEAAAAALVRAIGIDPDRAAHHANLAAALRRLGRDDAALASLDQAIALDPGRAELRFNRANLIGAHAPEPAISGFLAARTLNPALAEAASNLGSALRRRGRLDEALAHLDAAVVLRPDLAEAWVNLTTVMIDQGSFESAIELVDRALRRFPCLARLLLNKGIALTGLGRALEGSLVLDASVSADPASPDCAYHLAVAHRRCGAPEPALRSLARTLALDPTQLRAHELRAAVLADGGALELAEHDARHAVELDVESSSAWSTYAAVLQSCERLAEARAAFERARSLDPASVAGLGNHAMLLDRTGDRSAARALAVRAVALEPGSAEAHHQRGSLLRQHGESDCALACYDTASQLAPGNATYQLARAVAMLARGESLPGLTAYRRRWRTPGRPDLGGHEAREIFRQPEWRGECLGGRRLLVWGEQGLGDELWFSGYIGLLAGCGGDVLIECDGRLAPTLARSYPRCATYARRSPPEPVLLEAATQVAMGDLPLKLAAAETAAPTGYLVADPRRVAELRSRYRAGRNEALVGISWRSIKPRRDRSFEAPLPTWDPVFAVRGIRFVSLQYGDVGAEVAAAAFRSGASIVHDSAVDAMHDVDGFLAQVSAMDAVVSIANSAVAASHAIGRPCHVALRVGQDDWRYREKATATPWLPLARQHWPEAIGDWAGIFVRIGRDLATWRDAWVARARMQ